LRCIQCPVSFSCSTPLTSWPALSVSSSTTKTGHYTRAQSADLPCAASFSHSYTPNPSSASPNVTHAPRRALARLQLLMPTRTLPHTHTPSPYPPPAPASACANTPSPHSLRFGFSRGQ
jgi:hypothetical protein